MSVVELIFITIWIAIAAAVIFGGYTVHKWTNEMKKYNRELIEEKLLEFKDEKVREELKGRFIGRLPFGGDF
jgi:hypothetical protein